MKEDIKIEREEAFCDDWFMVREMGKTPTFADAIEWADTHPNWIKVEDRLPENDADVLVCFHYYDIGHNCTTVGHCEYVNNKGIRQREWMTDWDDTDMVITHWMPIVLPKEN